MKKNYTPVHVISFRQAIKTVILVLVLMYTVLMVNAQELPFPLKPIDEQRTHEIEKMLADKPAGLGEPYYKRKVWDKLLESGEYDRFLRGMRNYSFPPFSKEDYFSLSDSSASSSSRGLTMMRKRAEGLSKVTWAECLENKGRYTRMVEDGLSAIINQPSWVSPRSDFEFKNYKGIAYSVELTSSLYAHTIAQTLYLVGNKINPQLRKQAIDALYKRIFNPVLEKIRAQNKDRESNFLITPNNWNHVCLAGLVGAALAVIESKYDRAVFVGIGEYYSGNGLSGFGDDGYCTEGMVYYNYGFGHYILLRENIWQATKGKLDLFANAKVQKIATYVPRLEIINGVYPVISDSHEEAKPDAGIMTYLSRSLRLGLTQYDTLTNQGKTDNIRSAIMMVFPNSFYKLKPGIAKSADRSMLRSLFDHAGVLISRPEPGSPCKIGVAFKGGNNGESHNHNDVGSYTIVQGRQIIAGDPGRIPYTANIFIPEYRYTYKTVGSFGHPVPLVAGKEQEAGRQARSKIVRTGVTPQKDSMVLDIASAYNVPELKKLERAMSYDRTGSGVVSFTDYFEFTQPKTFETSISTRAEWKQTSANTLLLNRGGEKMEVSFFSPGNHLSLRSENISEGGTPYARIGIFIDKPVAVGWIAITYKPVN